MYFLVIAADRPGALDQRLAHRQEHIDYWTGLDASVMVGGAMLTGPSAEATAKGSVLLVKADSLEAAQALVAADPFSKHGIFGDDVRIEVLRPAIGDWFPG